MLKYDVINFNYNFFTNFILRFKINLKTPSIAQVVERLTVVGK